MAAGQLIMATHRNTPVRPWFAAPTISNRQRELIAVRVGARDEADTPPLMGCRRAINFLGRHHAPAFAQVMLSAVGACQADFRPGIARLLNRSATLLSGGHARSIIMALAGHHNQALRCAVKSRFHSCRALDN